MGYASQRALEIEQDDIRLREHAPQLLFSLVECYVALEMVLKGKATVGNSFIQHAYGRAGKTIDAAGGMEMAGGSGH